MSAAAPYRGVYINLDRSPLRRERMETQLSAYGLSDRYSRFPAVDGATLPRSASRVAPGEAGAFLSHVQALEQSRGTANAVHVLEDDAVSSEHVGGIVEEAIAAGLLDRFDILFTDSFIAPHVGMLKALKDVFDRVRLPLSRTLHLSDLQPMDWSKENFACMTSYIVGEKSIDRLLALYRSELANGPSKPIDLFLRDCAGNGRLRVGLLFPFVTSFRLDEVAASTIGVATDNTKASVMVLAVLRYLFFVNRDLNYAKQCLDEATKQNRRQNDLHHELMAQALEFVLSADFQQF